MDRILECIPNVSEGRDPRKIKRFQDVIQSVNGVKLLHTDTGYDANRTVFTFAGEPEAVIEAAFLLYQESYGSIDMSLQRGTHPRQGAVDVCPLVPLKGLSMEEAVNFSRSLGQRLDRELGIPGYYYEQSALKSEYQNLAKLRKGEYEGLPQKFETMPPDFGKVENWKKFGVTVVGARKLLIAYNINLDTRDVGIAKEIAGRIRQSGVAVKQADGTSIRKAGKLRSVKGIGWYIKDFDRVQVSYNLTDIDQNGILETFLQTVEEARTLGAAVTGSELIGLIPASELVKVGEHLHGGTGIKEVDLIHSAIDFLGLSEIKPFIPEERIIDWMLDS